MKPFPIAVNAALILFAVGFQAHKDNYANFPPERGPQTLLVTRVIDGDTVDACYLVPVRVRLHGMNATEKKDDNGEAGRALAAILKPVGLWQCELKGREKFGRLLGDFRTEDGKSVSNLMIAAGHARPWDGKGEKP